MHGFVRETEITKAEKDKLGQLKVCCSNIYVSAFCTLFMLHCMVCLPWINTVIKSFSTLALTCLSYSESLKAAKLLSYSKWKHLILWTVPSLTGLALGILCPSFMFLFTCGLLLFRWFEDSHARYCIVGSSQKPVSLDRSIIRISKSTPKPKKIKM